MSETRWQLIFVNPHTHHAYFTCLALSRLGPVQIICPPLLLQLWLGEWKREGLRAGGSFIGFALATPLSLIAFLLYKLKIFPEHRYCQCLGLAAWILARRQERSLLFVYQDYLLSVLRANRTCPVVVEMINCLTSPSQDNYITSIEAFQLASLILAPCKQALADLSGQAAPVASAPYGGDKLAYRSQAFLNGEGMVAPSRRKRQYKIVARAFSYMKGVDILLGALSLLQQSFFEERLHLTVVICGPVSELLYQRQITSLNQQGRGVVLQIQAGQFTQDSYLHLLQQADLFIMPSRLESMSLAALEALWIGCPALLSRACGVDQFNPNAHGELIDPNTPEALASILAKVFLRPQLLDEWREQLEKDRQIYTWEAYLEGVSRGVGGLMSR